MGFKNNIQEVLLLYVVCLISCLFMASILEILNTTIIKQVPGQILHNLDLHNCIKRNLLRDTVVNYG